MNPYRLPLPRKFLTAYRALTALPRAVGTFEALEIETIGQLEVSAFFFCERKESFSMEPNVPGQTQKVGETNPSDGASPGRYSRTMCYLKDCRAAQRATRFIGHQKESPNVGVSNRIS